MEEESMRDMSRLGFGEEVINCVTYGIMAFLCICSLPAVVVYSYNKPGNELAAGMLVFILYLFLAFLVSTLYRCMPFSTTHRYAFRKPGHVCVYLVIAGNYTPIVLMLIGGWQGCLILAVEWNTVLGGMLLKAISSKSHSKLSMVIYVIVNWTAIFFLSTLLSKASPPFLVLVVGEGVMHTIGAFFYRKPQKKCSHSVWHVCINLASTLHFIATVFVM